MFRTTRGKVRGVICAGLLLTGITTGMGAILGNEENEAQAASQPIIERNNDQRSYYGEVEAKAYRMVEALVVEKMSSPNSESLTLVYNKEIFNVEFYYLDTDTIKIGDTVKVRYYEGNGVMLED